ncbi:MAG: hypothetical protein WC353_06870 [Candidatus Peribacter sp.]
MQFFSLQHRMWRTVVRPCVFAVLLCGVLGMPAGVTAASIWNPTLLVNTESFNTIDDGDGTTNIELRFGDALRESVIFNVTAHRFEFSRGIFVGGSVTATGSLSVRQVMSGAALRVDQNADIWGNLSVSGATLLDGNLSASGALAVEGAAAFGSTIRIGGVTYSFPGSDGTASGKVLKTDGAGHLSWSTDIDTDTNTNAQTLCGADQYLDGDGNCVDVIEESEMDDMSELETQVGAVNIITSGEIDSESELESLLLDVTNVYTNNDGVLFDPSIVDNRYVNRSGDTMTGALTISNGGGLNASGSLITNTNLTINSDNGAADAVLTFGNDAGAETLRFNDTSNRFELSDDLAVTGQLSATDTIAGSGALAIEGNAAIGGTLKLNGVAYTFPDSAGANGQTLTTDGAGTLSWTAASVGVGSGGVVFLSPEYPHAVYTGSGTNFIGQLSYAFDATNKENYYHWTSSKAELQEYWIVARVRVPDNFSTWDANLPVQFRYRTTDASNAVNYASLRMLDTAGAKVTLTGGESLAATSWTTATVTGPEAAGTYTKGGYITLFVKMSTTSAGSADAGFINLNWETSAP